MYLWRVTIQTTKCPLEGGTQVLITVIIIFISVCNLVKTFYFRTTYSWKVESARGVKKT